MTFKYHPAWAVAFSVFSPLPERLAFVVFDTAMFGCWAYAAGIWARWLGYDIRKPVPFLVLMLLSLAGCAVFGGGADRAVQKNPTFRDGYEDGCAAATSHGSDLRDRPVGDTQLYENDQTYRKGWSSGFQSFRKQSKQSPAC